MSQTSSLSKAELETKEDAAHGQDETGSETEHAAPLPDYLTKPEPDEARNHILSNRLEHTPLYQPKDCELISHDSQKTIRTDPTYLSFGDGGTTATVTEWGQQMQISRHLGHGESGIYAIDHARTPEPNQYTKRRQGFLDMIDTCQGFGTDSGLPDSEWEHTTYWLRNRWPRVVFKRKDKWKLTFQWVVWNNVVIHDLLWQNLTENETIYVDVWTTLEILIRELDFVNSSHSFNGETCSRYEKGPGPGGYGFVKLHRFQQNGQSNDGQTMPTLESHGNDFNADAVAAAIGVFENGNPLKKEEFFQQREFTIKAGENRRLVTGYKLVLLSTEKEDWKLLTLTKSDVDIDYFLCQSQLEGSIPRDTFLSDRDFYIGRNLEHILSVCAIPITSAPAENDGEDEGANQKGEEPMVALTCGDIAGHRICTSASYFAFKFLLGVCRSLRQDHPLRARIKKTCLAHLRWVFERAKQKDSGGFARYYWANGEIISNLLPDGPTDTPFQILKAYEFFQFLENPLDKSELIEESHLAKQAQLARATSPATAKQFSEVDKHFGGEQPTRQGISMKNPTPRRATNAAESKQPTAETSLNQSIEPGGESEKAEKAEVRNFLNENNGDIAMKWVNALDKANKRDAFAWPHSTRAGMNYFRLDDHVWIWNAIKAISFILGWDTRVKGNVKNRERVDKNAWQYQRNDLMRRYEPEKMKREILQRFTTVHDVSKERILAVTRSPRETRFEFHSRDTALFYPIVDTMLGQGEERWLGLIKLQKRFTRTQDTDPDNLLRHGLGMLMENTWATDSTMRTDFLETKRALITTTLTNGLFPAQITGLGESERVSYHEDYLLHVSFEMPYILHATRPQEGPFQQATQEGLTKNRLYEEGPVKHTSILDGTIPFNDQIDVKSIIDIREEWLYNSPSFLDWSPLNGNHIFWSLLGLGVKRLKRLNRSMMALMKARGQTSSEENNGKSEDESDDDDDIMVDAVDLSSIVPDSEKYQPLDTRPDGHRHLMIDIGKKRPRMRKTSSSDERESRTHTYVKSWEKLLQVRTAHSAKKRFLWCRNPPGEYALMCFLASPVNEQPSLRLFFDRHAKCVTDFDDKANRVYNTWETQFHCSFVRLGKPARSIYSEDASSNLNESHKEERRPEPMLHSSMRPLPDLGGQELRPASMGFRFHGDFFDRFWTCHYVESYLGEPPRLDMNDYLSSNGEELKRLFQDSSAYVWQQRKVLETLLFHLILSEINKSVQKIIKAIQEELSWDQHGKERIKTPKPSQYDSEEYFNDLKAWAALHEILEFLGDNLENISNNVKSWNSREEDRRTEKPRWTNNDEKKYRDAITRALLECQRAERVLFAHRATIRSLSKTLNYRREEAKNEYDRNMSERNFRNNDNVKYFTYSTVIFLPLGFAASVYSMQAAPPTDVLQHMVIFSVVAFFTLLVIIAILPFLLEGSSEFRRVCREFVLHGFRGCCRNIYQDSKDLHGFWKLFYTKVPYTFSDLFTMQIPSYVLLLKGQSFNPLSSNRKEHAKKQKQHAPKPGESLDDNSKKSLKRETRDELKFYKSKGESWVQSWNRIVEPWNKSLRGHR